MTYDKVKPTNYDKVKPKFKPHKFKPSVKPSVKPDVSKAQFHKEKARQFLDELQKSEFTIKGLQADHPTNVNVGMMIHVSRLYRQYANLVLAKDQTKETKAEATALLHRANKRISDAQKSPDFQGQPLNTTGTSRGQADTVMSYLKTVYRRVGQAQKMQNNKYQNSAFYVPKDGAPLTPLSSPPSTPPSTPMEDVQPSSTPSNQPTPTQTAAQTKATLAGEGAGAGALNPQAAAKDDGVPAGGSSNDAGEEEDKPTFNPNVETDTERLARDMAEAKAGDTSTATGLKTGDGTTNPIGASADGIYKEYDNPPSAEELEAQGTANLQQAGIDMIDQDNKIRDNVPKRGAEGRAEGDEHGRDKSVRAGGGAFDPAEMERLIEEEKKAFSARLESQVAGVLDRFRQRGGIPPEDEEEEGVDPNVAAAVNRAEQEDRRRRRDENARQRAMVEEHVRRAAARAQAEAERRAAEAQAQGVPVNVNNLFDGINQRMDEEFNQAVQGVAVTISNAVERAAFLASMEQGEREDFREEARKAQVPAEAEKQADAQQTTPDPVDVDIDIASLSLGDAGSVPSTQQVGDAMTQDKAKERKEKKHRDSLSVQQLKQEIEALHSVYDSLVPSFKKADHQERKRSAMASGRPEELRTHLAGMMASVRRYYTQGGMRVGVIVSRQAFMGMQGGQAGGMSVPATSQQKGVEITKHGQSKFRPQVKNEQVMRGGVNTKKTLDNYIPKQDPQTRRPQRPHAQLTRFDSPHPSVQLPRRTRPYDIVLKTKASK